MRFNDRVKAPVIVYDHMPLLPVEQLVYTRVSAGMTYENVSVDLGLSRARVGQHYMEAFRKLSTSRSEIAALSARARGVLRDIGLSTKAQIIQAFHDNGPLCESRWSWHRKLGKLTYAEIKHWVKLNQEAKPVKPGFYAVKSPEKETPMIVSLDASGKLWHVVGSDPSQMIRAEFTPSAGSKFVYLDFDV